MIMDYFTSYYGYMPGPNIYGKDSMMRLVLQTTDKKEIDELVSKITSILKLIGKKVKIRLDKPCKPGYTVLFFHCDSKREGMWILNKAKRLHKPGD